MVKLKGKTIMIKCYSCHIVDISIEKWNESSEEHYEQDIGESPSRIKTG